MPAGKRDPLVYECCSFFNQINSFQIAIGRTLLLLAGNSVISSPIISAGKILLVYEAVLFCINTKFFSIIFCIYHTFLIQMMETGHGITNFRERSVFVGKSGVWEEGVDISTFAALSRF